MGSSLVPSPDFIDGYRALTGSIPTGVAILTSGQGSRLSAITLDSFLSVSWDPPTLLVSVFSDSRMMELLEEVDTFTLSVCAAPMKAVAQWLGQPGQPQYGLLSGIPVTEVSPTFPPAITGAVAYFGCRISDVHGVASHSLVVGAVEHYGTATGSGDRLLVRPLTRFQDEYGSFVPLSEV